jgi:hypothetical protein
MADSSLAYPTHEAAKTLQTQQLSTQRRPINPTGRQPNVSLRIAMEFMRCPITQPI